MTSIIPMQFVIFKKRERYPGADSTYIRPDHKRFRQNLAIRSTDAESQVSHLKTTAGSTTRTKTETSSQLQHETDPQDPPSS